MTGAALMTFIFVYPLFCDKWYTTYIKHGLCIIARINQQPRYYCIIFAWRETESCFISDRLCAAFMVNSKFANNKASRGINTSCIQDTLLGRVTCASEQRYLVYINIVEQTHLFSREIMK